MSTLRSISEISIILLFGISFLIRPSFAKAQYVQNQVITLDFETNITQETASINPFLDYRLQVVFSNGDQFFSVPGFYATDGNAAETSASEGGIWRVRFTPNAPGEWSYQVYFATGKDLAVNDDLYAGAPVLPIHGQKGGFTVDPIPIDAKGFVASGRLKYLGGRYLHTEDGQLLLKFGANSPENFLAYEDIDGTYSYDPEKSFLKSWSPHIRDWSDGDPTWQGSKGMGIIGALNYLADQGMNVVYALTLNIEGDARDVWPFLSHQRKDFTRYDVSKLAQWDIIFSHAEQKGIIMHLITQEKENELILDDGYTDVVRKLYYRELIARFGYHKNIIWNMGEENGTAPFWRQGQDDPQRFAMIRYLKDHDPFQNPLVIHTMSEPHEKDRILTPLLGFDRLDGFSMQISDPEKVHEEFKKWSKLSKEANRPFILMMDEIGPWHTGTKTDLEDPNHDTLRHEVLWGSMMAGGAGVEWYFGWFTPPNDLNAEDWRSRENIWRQSAIAKHFFEGLPLTEMQSHDELVDSENVWCLAKPGEVYALYTSEKQPIKIDLSSFPKTTFVIECYNPRTGETIKSGQELSGGNWVDIQWPETLDVKDWAAKIWKK